MRRRGFYAPPRIDLALVPRALDALDIRLDLVTSEARRPTGRHGQRRSAAQGRERNLRVGLLTSIFYLEKHRLREVSFSV
jgi:hypothetical protein